MFNRINKLFLLAGLFVITLISFVYISSNNKNTVEACEDRCQTTNGCPTTTPTPTTTPGVTPTPTITVTPTPTSELTPTPTPEENVGGCVGCGPVGAPVCNDTKPSAATLLNVLYIGNNQVKVTWQKVIGANDYSIYYGPTSGNYLYSVPSTGNTDNYIINGMTGGYYRVTSVNGCQPGEPSNELSLGGVGGAVLGASTMASTGTFAEKFATFIAFGSLALIGIGTKKLFSN